MNKPGERVEWLRVIAAYDFALHEMVLYLDTHPGDLRALRERDEYLQRRAEIIRQYEQQYGRYVSQPNDVTDSTGWHWIDNPWPWDYGND